MNEIFAGDEILNRVKLFVESEVRLRSKNLQLKSNYQKDIWLHAFYWHTVLKSWHFAVSMQFRRHRAEFKVRSQSNDHYKVTPNQTNRINRDRKQNYSARARSQFSHSRASIEIFHYTFHLFNLLHLIWNVWWFCYMVFVTLSSFVFFIFRESFFSLINCIFSLDS